MLDGDEFIKRVVPSLSRLFASSDRNLRRNLLESIDTYGQHLTTVSLGDKCIQEHKELDAACSQHGAAA